MSFLSNHTAFLQSAHYNEGHINHVPYLLLRGSLMTDATRQTLFKIISVALAIGMGVGFLCVSLRLFLIFLLGGLIAALLAYFLIQLASSPKAVFRWCLIVA